jgi:transcriptional regulator with XRE-family HTH domain
MIEQRERMDPHYSTLKKLAGALDMSVAQLVEEPALAPKA